MSKKTEDQFQTPPLPRKTFEYASIQTVAIELQRGFHKETIFKTFEF